MVSLPTVFCPNLTLTLVPTDNVFRVPFETSDRASEEIDYDKVDDRAYGCRNIERELAFKSIVKAGVEQQQHPCTRDERVRSFPMYSDFF